MRFCYVDVQLLNFITYLAGVVIRLKKVANESFHNLLLVTEFGF